jgi:hypothetical protein
MKTQPFPPPQRRNDVVFGSLLGSVFTLAFNASAYGTRTFTAVESTSNHPIVASAIAFFVLTTMLLGLMHEVEIGGEVLIVLVKMVKYRARSLRDISKRLEAQLNTWDDPEDQDRSGEDRGHGEDNRPR